MNRPKPDEYYEQLAELNRGVHLTNFPPEKRWATVEGVLFQPRSNGQPPLISISGRDQSGSEVEFWTDLPNAMYLLHMLAVIQGETKAVVPSRIPPACKEFEGNV